MPQKDIIKEHGWAIAAGLIPFGLGLFGLVREQKRREEHNKRVWGTSFIYEIKELKMWMIDPWYLKTAWAFHGGMDTAPETVVENDYDWQDIDHGYETRYD